MNLPLSKPLKFHPRRIWTGGFIHHIWATTYWTLSVSTLCDFITGFMKMWLVIFVP
jgi:hypothetical protein